MENTEKLNTLLGFRIGNELFAIAVENVIEVIRNQGVTSVPKTADYIIGITHFRGDILSVVSARKKLNVQDDQKAIEGVIIVVEFEINSSRSQVGIIADKVIGVLTMQEKEIKPVLEFGNYYNPEYLRGAFKYDDQIITILDIEKIFSVEEIEILNQMNSK